MQRLKLKQVVAIIICIVFAATILYHNHSQNESSLAHNCRSQQLSNTEELPTKTATSTCTSMAFSANFEGQMVSGRPFNFATDFLTALGFPIAFPVSNDDGVVSKSDPYSADDLVIVTATNVEYFATAMDAIALAQKHFPVNRIIVYDLNVNGLSPSMITKIRGLCNVEYRAFNFSRYPSHVRKLKKYAWKPLIIHDVLRSHPGVFWIDSSVRFSTGSLSTALRTARANGGIVLFDLTGHSIFSATHQKMYDYLPVDRQLIVNTQMYGASAILCFANKQIYESIIRWWFLCALTDECMAPTNDIHCRFAKGPSRRSTYAGCHRYDQSALNILIANHLRRGRPKPDERTSDVVVSGGPRPAANDGSDIPWATGETEREMYRVPGVLILQRGIKHRENVSVCIAHTKLSVSAMTYFGTDRLQWTWQNFVSLFKEP